MSDYLVRQLQETPNLDVRLGTRVPDGRGKTHLEALTLEELGTGHEEEVPASAVFVLIGAEPHTDWLRDVIELDERGYVLTRPRHSAVGKAWASGTAALRDKCAWRVRRRDVRYGSVKGVAGAVGEGSVTVGSVHRYLAEAAETHSASSQHIGMPGEYDERRGAARPRRTSIASRNRLPLFALLGANVISSVGNAGVQSTA